MITVAKTADLDFCKVRWVELVAGGDRLMIDYSAYYKWTGSFIKEKTDASTRKRAEALRKARLKIISHDGATANCKADIEIDGNYYISWIWLKDLKVLKR